MLFTKAALAGFFVLVVGIHQCQSNQSSVRLTSYTFKGNDAHEESPSSSPDTSTNGYPAPPINITFTSKVKTKTVGKDVQPKKFIEVTLFWEYVSNGNPNKAFDLYVLYNQNASRECHKEFAGYFNNNIPPNATNFTIPYNENAATRVKFHPNCSYIVTLSSLPRGNPPKNYSLSEIITIPACLHSCNCIEPFPTVRNLTARKAENSTTQRRISVFWNYSNSRNRTMKFKVSCSDIIMKTHRQKYNEVLVNSNPTGKYETEVTLSHSSQHFIHIKAVDENDCEASAGNVSVECGIDGDCFCKAKQSLQVSNFQVVKNANFSPTATFAFPSQKLSQVKHFIISISNGSQIMVYKDNATNGTDLMHVHTSIPCDSHSKIDTVNVRVVDWDDCYGPATNNIPFNCGGVIVTKAPSDSSSPFLSIAIITAVVIVFLVTVFLKRNKIKKIIMNKWNLQTVTSPQTIELQRNPMYVSPEIMDARSKGLVDHFEIAFCQLDIGGEIGKGAFGCVYSAIAEAIGGKSGKVTVAVKQLKDDAVNTQKDDFLAEIAMMKQVGRHPHIVTMLACCTLQQPYCMVMEYVPHGDLLMYLRRLRDEYHERCKIFSASFGMPTSNRSGYRSNFHRQNSTDYSFPSQNTASTTDGSTIQKENKEAGKSRIISYIESPTNNCSVYQFSLSDQNRHNQSSEYLLHPQSNSSTNTAGGFSTSYPIPEEGEEADEDVSPAECDSLIEQPATSGGGFIQKNYVQLASSTPIVSSMTRSNNFGSESCCLSSEELIVFALQIARGMSHLASKGITHRDLAARNVLIDEQKTLKISDFGLSRPGIYVTNSEKKIPLRWLSIEAIKDHYFSTASDVWAFGVVLWEICTLGKVPYDGISNTYQLSNHVLSGNQLEKPENCADEFYHVMQSCWNADPNFRPSFPELCDLLDKMKDEPHTYVNFDVLSKHPLAPTKLTFLNSETRTSNENLNKLKMQK